MSRWPRPIRRIAFLLAALAVGAAQGAELGPPLHEAIDAHVAAGWQARGVAPAELASDADFLRRVTLDLTGTIPTAAVARAFLSDTSPDKRAKLVDALLAGPEYARHMQHVFDVMLNERQHANYVTEAEWREYLRASFAANKPFDQLARELLGADGTDPATRPAARFFFVRTVDSYRVLNPNALTRDIGRLLLGINLQCAQCHDHPTIDDYRQADYHGLLAFVSRGQIATIQRDGKALFVVGEKPEGVVKFTSVFDPDQVEHTTTPHLPGASGIEEPAVEKGKEFAVSAAEGVLAVPAYSRRAQLVRLLPAVENAAFRRNIVNRLWALMLGRGLVHPVEVHHSGNPPSHPELLALLADEFGAHGCDVKWLLREIALSRTYQLSSVPPVAQAGAAGGEGAARAAKVPEEAFAVARLKPLSPEQFGMAFLQAAGHTDLQRAALGDKLTEPALYERLASAMGPLIKAYAGPPGQAETTFQASLDQALLLAHNDHIASLFEVKPGSLIERLSKETDAAAIAEELYLNVYTRRPTAEEAAAVAALLAPDPANSAPQSRTALLQDLLWAMLSSVEFRFCR